MDSQPPAAEANPYAAEAAAEVNPYAAEEQKAQEQYNEPAAEEQEYQPTPVEESNPYAAAADNQMPMGFGAERANLMNEQPSAYSSGLQTEDYENAK